MAASACAPALGPFLLLGNRFSFGQPLHRRGPANRLAAGLAISLRSLAVDQSGKAPAPYRRFEMGFDVDRAGVMGFSDSDQIPKLMISTGCCRLN